jgi:hypothetical protein
LRPGSLALHPSRRHPTYRGRLSTATAPPTPRPRPTHAPPTPRPTHATTEPGPQLPCDKFFELPGRPNVVYTIKDYSADKAKGAAEARAEAGEAGGFLLLI